MQKSSFEKQISSEKKEKIKLRQSVVVLSGVPLSGKTSLAKRLVAEIHLQVIDVDEVRNEIDETRKNNAQITMLPPEKEQEVMIASYVEMCKRAEEGIANGPVLLVGTFSRAEFKEPLEKLVGEMVKKGIPCKIFLLTVPDQEIEKRLEKRRVSGSLSNIDSMEKYQYAKGFFKKIEFAPVVEITTTEQGSYEEILKSLPSKL